MKRIFSVALLSLALVSCGEQQTEAQVGQYTVIEVDEVYDAGTAAKGEIVTADIKIKNVGDYPLVIANIKASCSCTVSDYDETQFHQAKLQLLELQWIQIEQEVEE